MELKHLILCSLAVRNIFSDPKRRSSLGFVQVYRGSGPELVLRVSEVDAEGNISVHNTVYSTEKVELLKNEQDNVEILIHTYDSEKKGDCDGLER